jgi:hypothetical protein
LGAWRALNLVISTPDAVISVVRDIVEWSPMTWLSTMEHHFILGHFALFLVVYLSGKLTILLVRIDYKLQPAIQSPPGCINEPTCGMWCHPANE